MESNDNIGTVLNIAS